MIHHRVDGVLQLQNFALHIDRDFLGEITIRDCGRYFGDVAHLAGQVSGHEIHAVGQILPGSGDTTHIRLPAKFSFRSHFARHARHFRGERAQLIHHRVDGVFQLQNFAFHINGDLLGQIAVRDGGRDLRDVAHLTG